MIEKAYTETSIGQCHYRHQSGQGIPIVFLHQTPSSSLMYEKLMSLLPQNTCVAIDTPGFGMSDDISGNPSIEDYGNCIVEALESLDLINELFSFKLIFFTKAFFILLDFSPEIIRST